MTAATLWAAVVASYDAEGLVALTNIRDPSQTTILTARGESAAQGVIDLWPIYAQSAYDSSNAAHVEVGKRGVIAMLYSRGGTAQQIAKVEWEEVFGDAGMIAKLRNTGARARITPTSNSGVQQSVETVNGQAVLGWSDPGSLPLGLLPLRRSAIEE